MSRIDHVDDAALSDVLSGEVGARKRPAAAPRVVMSRRAMLGTCAAAVAAMLAGCQRPSTLPVTEVSLGKKRADKSAEIMGKDVLRIGMEAAYAPYNWQTSEASEFTIPIENVKGAFADGYDVQVAKRICKKIGADPVAVKMSFSGLVDALNNGQIDMIVAGMSVTPEREQAVDFSDPYFVGYFGLFVKEGSPYASATSLRDFSGAQVLGQKDTMLDDVIDEIPGVVHQTPVDSVPNVFSHLMQGTCDAVTYNTENEKGYMKQNPGIVPVRFAKGEGFKGEVAVNIGVPKGCEQLRGTVNDVLAGIDADERQQIWDACLDRQPA